MSFNVIHENIILADICEFTVLYRLPHEILVLIICAQILIGPR